MSAITIVPFRSQANTTPRFVFHSVIDGICSMAWDDLDSDEVMRVATAYYFFSVQFRESLEVARERHPNDEKARRIVGGRV